MSMFAYCPRTDGLTSRFKVFTCTMVFRVFSMYKPFDICKLTDLFFVKSYMPYKYVSIFLKKYVSVDIYSFFILPH